MSAGARGAGIAPALPRLKAQKLKAPKLEAPKLELPKLELPKLKGLIGFGLLKKRRRRGRRAVSLSSGGSLGAVFEESHHGFRDAGRGGWVLACHEPLGDGDLLLEVRRLDESRAAGAQR